MNIIVKIFNSSKTMQTKRKWEQRTDKINGK